MALGGALKALYLVLLVVLCCVFAQKDVGFAVSPRDCPHAGLVPGNLSPSQSQASLGSFKPGPAQLSPNVYGSALHGLSPESSTSASVKLASSNSWMVNLPGSSNYNPVTPKPAANRCVSGSSGYPQPCSDTMQSIGSLGGIGSAEKLGTLPGYVSNPTQSVGSWSSGSALSPGTQTSYNSVSAQHQEPLSYGSQTAHSIKGIGSQMISSSTLPIDGPTQWLGFQGGSKQRLGTGPQPSYSSGLDLGVSQSLYGYPQLSATSDQVANYASSLGTGSLLASTQWAGSESSGFQGSHSFPGSGHLLGGASSDTCPPLGNRISAW
nr:uncharacterized protein LOC111838625 [Paramormyrops kingsleyae]